MASADSLKPTIFPPASVEGGVEIPDNNGLSCEGDDFLQNVSDIVGANPNELARGQETDLKIYANGLACRASFILYGGGIQVLGGQPVYQDPNDMALRYFQLRVKVDSNAPLGPRKISILNPNGSSKTKDGVITIVPRVTGSGAACQNSKGNHQLFILIFTLLCLTLLRLRIRHSV